MIDHIYFDVHGVKYKILWFVLSYVFTLKTEQRVSKLGFRFKKTFSETDFARKCRRKTQK